MGEIFKFVVSSILVMVEVSVFLARNREERKQGRKETLLPWKACIERCYGRCGY